MSVTTPRVLMFCTRYPPLVGGAELQAQSLASAIHESGAPVEVLTVGYERDWPEVERSLNGLTVHRIPYNDLCRRFPYVRGLGMVNTALLGFQISRAITRAAHRFDVLHAHNLSGPMTAFALRSARRAGLGTLAKISSTGDLFDLRTLDHYFLWGKIARHWLRRDVMRWQASSLAVRDELRRAGIPDGQITVLPNGVSLQEEPNEIPAFASRFLYLGRLAATAPRDVPGLLDAFVDMSLRYPNTELAIVGNGDRYRQIRELVASRTDGARVQIPGVGDGVAWRKWAHCLVQPSFVEGLSNALLEGMASGLACVAYDIPPNREALDDGRAGILVPVGHRAALREAIEALSGTPGLARSWGQRARARAESRYDMRKVAAQAIEVYRQLSPANTA